MVIEYAGEMVRQSVADRREAGSYNQLVGAGTYVFSLNDDFMVDATKAGNMAHLLNHSCQPNCYSKHVHVWDEDLGDKVPHVVICAKQAIPVGEELTYDYRYSHVGKHWSQRALKWPCWNCGCYSDRVCLGHTLKQCPVACASSPELPLAAADFLEKRGCPATAELAVAVDMSTKQLHQKRLACKWLAAD